jgi:predicted HicB family RNase H-like nuclease
MDGFIPTEFKPVKAEKILISLRIDVEKLNQIDVLASKNDISRNEFIMQSIDFAIKHMSEE